MMFVYRIQPQVESPQLRASCLLASLVGPFNMLGGPFPFAHADAIKTQPRDMIPVHMLRREQHKRSLPLSTAPQSAEEIIPHAILHKDLKAVAIQRSLQLPQLLSGGSQELATACSHGFGHVGRSDSGQNAVETALRNDFWGCINHIELLPLHNTSCCSGLLPITFPMPGAFQPSSQANKPMARPSFPPWPVRPSR
ncbi:unnamed protein product [Symbiodinium natans]|uniref:Uncharacterized protein n=1 Tax=Symbiodinium natans TaxID=878477 RepID=A0A812S070_9DINO|nr:unnamed protein product [Symbiodinium natans]